MDKIIITGVTGFIGGALARKFLNDGCTVYGVGRNREKLDKLSHYEKFVPVEADFSKYNELHSLIDSSDIDVMIHCAWNGVYGAAFKDYSLQFSNADYACEALVQAAKLNCKKFIFVGTANEFETGRMMEQSTYSASYTNIYATAKLAAEMACKTLASNLGIEFCAGRICMAYGENNYSRMLPNVVINQLLQGIEPKLVKGNNLYDLIYIDDIVDAFAAIAESGKNMSSYYIGHRKLVTFKELVTEIRDVVNPEINLFFGAYPDADERDYSQVDLDALWRDTGFECHSDFRLSIQNTAKWLQTVEI